MISFASLNLVPDLGLRPSVVDNGIETCLELGPEAESRVKCEQNWDFSKATNVYYLISLDSRAFLPAKMPWPAP